MPRKSDSKGKGRLHAAEPPDDGRGATDSENTSSARSVRRGRSRSSRRLSVRSQLRQEPDVRRIARAVIDLALAQAEADAAAADQRQRDQSPEAER